MNAQTHAQTPPPKSPKPKHAIRWWRIALQVLLALITAGLVYAIMLPAIVAPKSKSQESTRRR